MMNETIITKLEELLNEMDNTIESAKDYYSERSYMYNDSVKELLEMFETERDSLEELILALDE